VSGKAKTILTDSSGKTLYYRTSDSARAVTCTSASCIGAWPPLLKPSGAPTGGSGVTGTLTTISDPNGSQVEYNGHPLYRYAADHKAGDTFGDGVGGVWFAATVDLHQGM
jgi:predicted lipoprotein with Yx(FWY)xxD motif